MSYKSFNNFKSIFFHFQKTEEMISKRGKFRSQKEHLKEETSADASLNSLLDTPSSPTNQTQPLAPQVQPAPTASHSINKLTILERVKLY